MPPNMIWWSATGGTDRNNTNVATAPIRKIPKMGVRSNTPQWVLKANSSDQVAHLLSDPRSATGRMRLPSPVCGKTHAMPTQDSLGPNDGDGAKDARAATIQPNEQSTIDPMQMRPAWRSPLY